MLLAVACARSATPTPRSWSFSIPSLTGFEVLSGTDTLAEVGEAAPVGDYQYRRAQLTDGSGATTTWRIAVSVPAMLRNPPACPHLVQSDDVSDRHRERLRRAAQRLASLVPGLGPVSERHDLRRQVQHRQTGNAGQSSAPTPTGDCPGGAFAKSFDVCERCGTSGLSSNKTLWGCDLADARNDMGLPGCLYTLRTSVNCPSAWKPSNGFAFAN